MKISFRLDKALKRKLEAAARGRGISESELIRESLDEILFAKKQQTLFGCYRSGRGDLSARAREVASDRIDARRSKRL